ncbi:sensor histidine kinase [Sanguibacter suaedae]|uniref:sensor histidine kinase n=1 Tax=Sanguibacter suaedae TaxID=2795737 RepID=UPI0027DE3047|nr:HAMP domain-containing sensor histidine kinase [Sanguibacter suaedae]
MPPPPGPGAGAPAGPVADLPAGKHVGPLTALWARTPLRVRLVGIVTLVLLAGLGIAGVLATTLLSRSLVGQVDARLAETAEALADNPLSVLEPGGLPSDFYIALFPSEPQYEPWRQIQKETQLAYGEPQLTSYTFTEESRPEGPFSIGAVDVFGSNPRGDWRVVALTPRDPTGARLGTFYVGLPLAGTETTVKTLTQLLALSAVLITAFGAVVGYVAVRGSLRPLRDIERTAAAIADGDLGRRVRQAPTTTEVGSLAHSLNVMLAQIEQGFAEREASEARMRRFVSDASHELRTPLAAVRGYGELYRMGALTTPESITDTMRRIEDSASRMGALVEDLLHLARLDEGRELRREPVDLAVLAADAMSDLHALDPTRSVRLVPLDAQDRTGPCLVVGDDDRLRQVLANLVGNAARHTPQGTPVEVALGYTTTGGVRTGVLEVRDHGPGIRADQADRVFERFFRLDSSRNRASGGSGLGLAIVAAIVGAHGGKVAVSATDGGGLTVRIELPAASVQVGDD